MAEGPHRPAALPAHGGSIGSPPGSLKRLKIKSKETLLNKVPGPRAPGGDHPGVCVCGGWGCARQTGGPGDPVPRATRGPDEDSCVPTWGSRDAPPAPAITPVSPAQPQEVLKALPVGENRGWRAPGPPTACLPVLTPGLVCGRQDRRAPSAPCSLRAGLPPWTSVVAWSPCAMQGCPRSRPVE